MMRTALTGVLLASAILMAGCKTTTPPKTEGGQNVSVIQADEVEWTHLNPKRGDLAPKAGTLWGDRNGSDPTGFLLKPPSDFESPPHIHNVSYRGVVIKGVMHNDDPHATEMWMPAGSFWTQPKGEIHITSAAGSDSLAYIEIEEGPYLVLPEEEHFDSGERPVNVDEGNVVWLNGEDAEWVEESGAEIAYLWGNPSKDELNGSYIKLPAGFSGTIDSDGSIRAVVVKGQMSHQSSPEKVLGAGGFFSSDGEAEHWISVSKESVVYIRSDGKYEVEQ